MTTVRPFDPWAFSACKPAVRATLGGAQSPLPADGKRAEKPTATEPWSAADWVAFWEERAAIAEFDGGLTRAAAETVASDAFIARWLAVTPPAPGAPETCAACAKPAGPIDSLPVLIAGDVRSVHPGCARNFFERRQAQAHAALAAILEGQ